MLLDALKPLLDSGVLTEDTQRAINEAWKNKLTEAREQIRTEVREEFANRYEHDRKVMVQALDRMVTESLTEEIKEFHQDKRAATAQRVQAIKEMKQKAAKFEHFLTQKLAEEITEFRKDRKQVQESSGRLERFVMKTLAKEITEFAQDKRAVVETRVKLVSEARQELNSLRKQFIARSSKAIKETVARHLRSELTQLREDIDQAKKNNFGRKIFEAFATEFSNSQLNESAELRKLNKLVENKNTQLAQSQKQLNESKQLLVSRDKQIQTLKQRQVRESVLNELLNPLAKERQRVMRDLLENVQTDQLRGAYDKYLPAVLNDRTPVTQGRRVVTEAKKTVTGDRTTRTADEQTNIIDIRRLAGL